VRHPPIIIKMHPFLTLPYQRNVKLLSFGADEDGAEDVEPTTFKKKPIFRTDCECFGTHEFL
jgi:hypothetical protein